jgi:DNA-binding PadR family transcriptional regulator
VGGQAVSGLTPTRLYSSYRPIYRHLSRCGPLLSIQAKLVLVNLLERLGPRHGNDALPTQARISADTDMSDRSVRDALRELEGMGWVETRRTNTGNVYTLDVEAILTWAEVSEDNARSDQQAEQDADRSGTTFRSDRHTRPVPSIEGRSKEEGSKKGGAVAPSPDGNEVKPKRITEAVREEMREAFPDLDEAAEYERATNHVAYRKAIDKRRYYRTWLERSRAFALERRNSNGKSQRGDGRDSGHHDPLAALRAAGRVHSG